MISIASKALFRRAILLSVILFYSFTVTLPVSAQGTQVLENSVVLDFPNGVTFNLDATSQAKITQVALLYSVVTTSCVDSQARQDMDITTNTLVKVKWTWDLNNAGDLPPGSVVKWQWEIIDAQGNKLLTDLKQIRIEDPNFKWQKLVQAPITLYWAKGSLSFGKALLNIATSSLDRVATKAGLKVTEPIQIIIYPSAEEMRAALVFTDDWAGGVAFPNFHVVLIGIGSTELDWAKEVIPHELTHLVTGMRIFNCAGSVLPTWLNEGISEYAQGPVSQAAIDNVTTALNQGSLPALSSLSHGFSSDSTEAEQAYDQSWMVVTYMIDRLGADKLDQLLGDVRDGMDVAQAMRDVYGLDADGIDQAWRASLGYGTAPVPNHDTPTPAPTMAAAPTMALMQPSGQATSTVTPADEASSPADTASATAVMTATVQPSDNTQSSAPTLAPSNASSGWEGSPLYILLIALFCFLSLALLVVLGLFFYFTFRKKHE